MTDREKIQLRYKVSTVFSPTSPIDKFDLFAGRSSQVKSIFSAVGQKGEHVIIYGDRGVGKTSLANVLNEVLTGYGIKSLNSVKINCDAQDNFSALWNRIFRELPLPEMQTAVSEESTTLPLFERSISPDDVRFVLQRFVGTTIIIIDELDRIEDRQATKLLADTIKALSDHAIATTIVLVGVADSVSEIIADHKSIERALIQIRMPPMSLSELGELIDKNLSEAKMTIREEAKRHITALSQGLPHYTHLLGLLAAEHAIDKDRRDIELGDVQEAVKKAIERTTQSNVEDYLKATSSSHKESLFAHILLACAFATTDDLGYFYTADVREPLSIIKGHRYEIPAFARHLNQFCEASRGSVLRRIGLPRQYKYRFNNPQMRPFVTMNGLAKKLINAEAWNKLSGMN